MHDGEHPTRLRPIGWIPRMVHHIVGIIVDFPQQLEPHKVDAAKITFAIGIIAIIERVTLAKRCHQCDWLKAMDGTDTTCHDDGTALPRLP